MQDIFATVKPYGKEVYTLQTGSEFKLSLGKGKSGTRVSVHA